MNSQLQAMFRQAIQAFQMGKYDEAIFILEEELKGDIDSSDAIFELGITFAKANRLIEASAIFCCLQGYKNDDVRIPYNLGLIYSLQGEHQLALEAYNFALEIQPDDVGVLINKGSTYNDIKNYALALEVLEKALKIKSDIPEGWSNKGIALNNLDFYQESINAYNEAIKLTPSYHEAWSNKSAPLNKLKRFLEALEACDRALSLKPDYAEAWSNKGITLDELKRHDEAIVHYDRSLSLKPDYAEAWSNKGVALNELKRYDDAIIQYDRALSLKPDYAEAWSNKGVTLNELRQYDEAVTHYDRALSLKPDYAEAWSNKGVALNELKRYDDAIIQYDRALSLKPDYAEAWSNKGVTLDELKRHDEAIAHYDRSLSLKPDYAEAWSNKGVSLNELKRYDEAIIHYGKALSLKSDIDWTFGDLLHTKMKMCAWSGLADSLETVSKKVRANEAVISPLPIIALNDDLLLHKRSSEIYVEKMFPKNPALGLIHKYPLKDKIRIGYFSADFRNHPVSLLTSELFELHDKNKFEIIAFSFGADDKSPMRSRLSQAFNQFIDVSSMSDLNIAKLSRDLNIDIAVDLGGHTAGCRTGIFSYLAAPVQLSYIGYLGTMGAEYFDYLIADETILPVELQKFYSEKIIYLPSYQVNDRKRSIADKRHTRAELGIPETAFIFCCFNNNYKILPDTFDRWMRILGNVEGSILFLYAENKWAEENLRKHAEARDIDSARLIFGRHLPNDEYLARYRMCDLFLDTFPYNAGTTASDALWAGLPVLTLMGNSFASRVAASLLNAIGLSELVTNTQEEYEALAIELAMNPKTLAEIKLKLAANRLTTTLFDTPLFTKNLEAAYIKMYERYRADLQPDHIYVD